MKIRWILLTFMVLSLVLTACGGSSGDPKKPVEDFWNAFEKMDAEKAADSLCKEYKGVTKESFAALFEGLEAEGGKIEIDGVELKVENKTDDSADVVAIGGTMKLLLGGDVVEEEDLADGEHALKVIKEDGKWVICDPSFAENFGP